MIENTIITDTIHPTDVKVYIENGVPYLDYTGVAESNMGTLKIHFPKVGLDFTRIITEREEEDICCGIPPTKVFSIVKSFNLYATDDKWMEYEILERSTTKEQLEKELGYKIKFTKER